MCGHWLHYHRCRLHSLTNILLFVLFFYHETFCGLSPSESDSEVSLSGFETVASQSFDEDEEEDEGSIMLSSPCSSPTSMLQEDHHGDKDEAQPNGITKHRSAGLYAPPHPDALSFIRHSSKAELNKRVCLLISDCYCILV